MYIAPLFKTAKLWNQPRCPKPINKENVVCICSKYYSPIKKNEIKYIFQEIVWS
jgi:hypothetical protein